MLSFTPLAFVARWEFSLSNGQTTRDPIHVQLGAFSCFLHLPRFCMNVKLYNMPRPWSNARQLFLDMRLFFKSNEHFMGVVSLTHNVTADSPALWCWQLLCHLFQDIPLILGCKGDHRCVKWVWATRVSCSPCWLQLWFSGMFPTCCKKKLPGWGLRLHYPWIWILKLGLDRDKNQLSCQHWWGN